MRWRSGALGSINVTMLTYPKNLEGSITIIGEKGTVRIGGVAVNEIQHWEFADQDPDDEPIKAASYETTSVYGFGHPLYYDNVIKALRGEARAGDRRARRPALAGIADRQLSLRARRAARCAAAGVLSMAAQIHPSAIVDAGRRDRRRHARLALGARQRAGASIGARCSLGQNVFVGNRVRIGNNVKIQNNVSVYDNVTLEDDVFCGPSMVFTNVYNPRSAVSRKNEYRDTLVKRGATLGANCTIVCGVTDRRVRVRRRRRGGQPRRAGLRADGRRARRARSAG